MKSIRIPQPSSDSYFWENQIVRSVKAKDNALPVLENRMPEGSFIIIGEIGNKQTEIANPVGFDNGSIILSAPLKQNHTQATNIYVSLFKNIEIYRTIDGQKSLWSTEPIRFSSRQTPVIDKDYETLIANGQSVEYTYSFVNSQNNRKTQERKAVIGDSFGVEFENHISDVDSLIRELNKKAFGDPESTKRERSEWILDLNYAITNLFQSVISVNDEEYFFCVADINIAPNRANYPLPSFVVGSDEATLDFLEDVRINGCTIARRSLTRNRQTCNATCDTEIKTEEVDECACPTEKKEECENPCVVCNTEYFYQLTHNEIIISPTPDREALLTLSYFGIPEPITEDSTYFFIPAGYRYALIVSALYHYFSLNDRTPEGIQYAQWLKLELNEQKKLLTEKINRRALARRTTIKPTKGIRVTEEFGANPFNRFNNRRTTWGGI